MNGQLLTDYISYGHGAPSAAPSVGVVGQWSLYQDVDTGDYYYWDLLTTAWVHQASTGPTGATGATGSTGPTGATGSGGTPSLAVVRNDYIGASINYNNTSWGDAYASLDISITTGAHRVLVLVSLSAHIATVNHDCYLDVWVDGAATASTNGLAHITSATEMPVAFAYLTDVLTTGTHTIKLYAKTDGTVLYLKDTSGGSAIYFTAIETLLTT